MNCNCKKTEPCKEMNNNCAGTPNFFFIVLILFILLAIIMGGVI